LERLPELVVELQQRAGDPVPYGARLAGRPATAHIDGGIELAQRARELQRLADHHAQRLAREILLEGAAIDQDIAAAGLEPDAGDGGLAPAGSVVASVGR